MLDRSKRVSRRQAATGYANPSAQRHYGDLFDQHPRGMLWFGAAFLLLHTHLSIERVKAERERSRKALDWFEENPPDPDDLGIY